MTLDLLSICNDKNIEEQLEDSKTNKSSIYKMISDTLKTIGDEKNSAQCKIRIHTLKRNFFDGKKKLNTSGKPRILCRFYNEINDVLGKRFPYFLLRH